MLNKKNPRLTVHPLYILSLAFSFLSQIKFQIIRSACWFWFLNLALSQHAEKKMFLKLKNWFQLKKIKMALTQGNVHRSPISPQ